MAKMTRYKRPGIQVAQPQSTDFAGLREAKRMGSVISQQVNQMQGFLERQAQQEAEFKAGEIIREKGATAATEIMERGGPKTYMEQQVFKSGMRIASQEIETNAIGEINRVLMEAEANHITPSQLNDRLRDIADGFPAGLSEVDGETAGLLQSKLNARITEAQDKYFGIHSKYLTQQEQGRAFLGIDAREKAALDSITLPGDKKLRQAGFEAHLAETAQFMRDKQFSEEEISKWLISTREQGIVDSSLADFSRLGSMEEKVKYLAKMEENPPKGLTREKARSLISALRTDMTNTQKLYKSEITSINGGVTELGKVLTKGGLPSNEDLNKLDQRISALPDEAKGDLQTKVNNLRFKKDRFASLRKQTPVDLQNTINEMANGIPGIGGEGNDTLLEAEMLKDAKTLLSTMNTEVKKDPLSWAQLNGNAKVEPLPLDDVFKGLGGDPDAMKNAQDAFANRQLTAHTVHNFYDSPLKFFTNEEAEKIQAYYDSSDGQEKSIILQAFNKFFGSNAGAVFNELSEIDPAMGHVGGLIDIGLKKNAEVALNGFDKIAEKAIVDFDETMANSTYSDYTGRTFLQQPKANQGVYETAKAIYTQKAAERNVTTYNQDLWEESINMASGFDPVTGSGGIVEINGGKTLLPPGFTEDHALMMMEKITMEQLQYMNPGVEISAENLKSLNENDEVRLMTHSDGKYFPYILSSTDEPIYFKDKKGALIELDIVNYQGLGAQ